MLKDDQDDGRGDGDKDVNGLLLPELEERLWVPKGKNQLNGEEIDKFLIISRSVGTFARALDCSSSVKQPRYFCYGGIHILRYALQGGEGGS